MGFGHCRTPGGVKMSHLKKCTGFNTDIVPEQMCVCVRS